MLEYVRKHQKLLQIALLLLIVPSFVFFGVSSYSSFGSNPSDIAKIGDETISQQDFEKALKTQAQNSGLPEEFTRTDPFKLNILNQLIQQKLLQQELHLLQLQVSDARLANQLLLFPEIAGLRNADGSIDQVKYRQLLNSNGLSISQFQNIKKAEIIGGDLQNALVPIQSNIKSDLVAHKLIAFYSEEREVRALFYLRDQYLNTIQISDQELKDYYSANLQSFQSKPMADVEYVLLKRDPKIEQSEFAKKSDLFANLVYEQADSLDNAAEKMNIKIDKLNGLTANGLASLPKDHPLNQLKVLKAIFTDEALKLNKNTEALQVSNGDLISVHVTKFHSAQPLNFDEVKSRIEALIRSNKAEELAIKMGKDKAELLQSEKNIGKEFGRPVWVSRDKPLDLTGEPYARVFGADRDKLPQIVYAKIPGTGAAIYSVNQVRRGSSKDTNTQLGQFKQLSDMSVQNELSAYFSNMRESHTVKMLKSLQ